MKMIHRIKKSFTDEDNTPLAPTGQDADDEEERKTQAEHATYTIICQDLNGVTLFTDSKEGDVGIQITVDPPTINGYITQSDSQNIELVSDNAKNILTFNIVQMEQLQRSWITQILFLQRN